MTNSLIEINKCNCCDTHIFGIDGSLLRGGLHDEEVGLVSIADLSPEQVVLLRDKCDQAIKEWVGEI